MMSPVASFDIQLTKGIMAEMQLTWSDASGQAIDVTNFESYMQFRNEYTKELLLDATSYIYNDSDPLHGVIVIRIPSSVTKNITFEKCGFDILMKNVESVYQIAKGKVYVTDTLTKIA